MEWNNFEHAKLVIKTLTFAFFTEQVVAVASMESSPTSTPTLLLTFFSGKYFFPETAPFSPEFSELQLENCK